MEDSSEVTYLGHPQAIGSTVEITYATEPFESGYFEAHQIVVPRKFCSEETGIPNFQQVDPHRSLVVVSFNEVQGDLDFVGDPEVGALLANAPDLNNAHISILLPLGSATGFYEFHGFFYEKNTSEIVWEPTGNFIVESDDIVDCGCHTLGSVIHEVSDAVDSRLAICAECPSNVEGVCMECGCLLSYKTTQKAESCPLGKW